MLFRDRQDAGRKLGEALKAFSLDKSALVLGLPRGGVVVAAAAAEVLGLKLDIIAPRKISAPGNPELAIGALAGDEIVIEQELIEAVGASRSYLEKEIAKEKREAERRLALYRKGRAPISLSKKTVVLIDDGIATGATMLVSIRFVLKQGAKRCIAAVPVAPPEAVEKLKEEGAVVLSLYTPASFYAISQFYDSFSQTEDSEVISLLSQEAAEG